MKYKKTQSKTIPPLLKEMEKNVKKLYKSDSQVKVPLLYVHVQTEEKLIELLKHTFIKLRNKLMTFGRSDSR